MAKISSQDRRKQMAKEIDRLEAQIGRFRIDAQRFLAGDLPAPPEEQRDRIAAELRRLRSARLTGAAESFRLGALEARFTSHLQLFGRRLRELEEGDKAMDRDDREGMRPDPRKGVIFGQDSAAVEALYSGLYLRDGQGSPKMDLEKFRGYIERQAAAIRAKTGCADVKFRIATEDGKMKIKAKPIRRQAAI